MNAAHYMNAYIEEKMRAMLCKSPMQNDDVKRESSLYDAPEQVVVECEMIWLQVNQ